MNKKHFDDYKLKILFEIHRVGFMISLIQIILES
jgi:hypothetical protein